jgi:LmbE family N-acetylglucosaminyl deacetylase
LASRLPAFQDVLVVVAHPDDESFGLGGVLHAFAESGSRLSVLCFTHGEASTLHGVGGDLAVIRGEELHAASERLGVERVELLDYPDGSLAAQAPADLAGHVQRVAHETGAGMLLVFDHGGITGHADHQAATDAALHAAAILHVTARQALFSGLLDRLTKEDRSVVLAGLDRLARAAHEA